MPQLVHELYLSILSNLPATGSGGWVDWWPAILAFGTTVLGIWLLARRWRPEANRRRARLDSIPREAAGEEADRRGVLSALAPALAAQIPESGQERSDFKQLLRSAGLYSPAAATTIYALRFVLLVLPMIVAGVLALVAEPSQGMSILIAGGVAGACLSIVPRLYVFFRRRTRIFRIRQGLPDTLDMLSMCIDAGLGLTESLEHVARHLTNYPEVSMELAILRRQAEVSSLQVALADFAARVNIQEVRQLANLLTRGDRLGTKLAGSLLGQAHHLRVARRQVATTLANKTPVKLVLPVMFCFAPAALILLTAPAVLELTEFLAPSDGQSVLTASGESFGPAQIVRTLGEVDQNVASESFGATGTQAP